MLMSQFLCNNQINPVMFFFLSFYIAIGHFSTVEYHRSKIFICLTTSVGTYKMLNVVFFIFLFSDRLMFFNYLTCIFII